LNIFECPTNALNDSPTSSVSSGKQHAHLLREFYGINGDSPEQQDCPTTLLSWQFDGAQSIFEVSARLANGKQLLSESQFVSGDHILLQIRTTRLSLSARENKWTILLVLDWWQQQL
jgi:hypothetical protein